MAIISGVGYAQVHATERGLVSRPNRHIVALVAATDGPAAADQIVATWTQWRQDLAAKIREASK